MGPERIAELVDRHSASLVLYARQWCRCPDDVVQAAFVSLVRQSQPPTNLVPWLYRVVRNGAIDAGRAARRREKHETIAAGQSPAWFHDSQTLSYLDAETATAALQNLPDEIREIMVAHLWGGLTFEQIAELVGSSASTSYRRFALGLELLRQTLGVTVCQRPNVTTRS